MKAKIHQLLQNPIYYGEFYWLDQLHQGLHTPIISRDLFERESRKCSLQRNRPRQTKHQHVLRRTGDVRALRMRVHGGD